MRRHWARGLVLAGILLTISGCTYLSPSSGGPVPQVSPTYKFPDVPVPSTMHLDTQQSFVYEAGGIRAGVLIYRGHEKFDELVRFFRDNLKQYGWHEVSSFEHVTALMTYEKPGWSLSIEIHRGDFDSTELVIRYGPSKAS